MAQLETTVDLRRKAIGGTDISALLGLNPWRSAADVFLEKLGRAESRVSNPEAAYWGTALEEPICRRYAEQTGEKLYVPRPRFMRHPDRSWMGGSPDRLVENQKKGIDAKTARLADAFKWGESGTDEVPIQYLLQCHWYMELLDYDTWDVAALLGGSDFRIYEVKRDKEFGQMLISKAERFWFDHVLAKVPPPVDASPGTSRMLDVIYPKHSEDLIAGTTEMDAIADELQAAKHNFFLAKDAVAELENRFKEMIGDHAGIEGDGWKCTWRQPQPKQKVLMLDDLVNGRKEVKWEDIFRVLGIEFERAKEIIEGHSKPIERSRRFYFDFRKRTA